MRAGVKGVKVRFRRIQFPSPSLPRSTPPPPPPFPTIRQLPAKQRRHPGLALSRHRRRPRQHFPRCQPPSTRRPCRPWLRPCRPCRRRQTQRPLRLRVQEDRPIPATSTALAARLVAAAASCAWPVALLSASASTSSTFSSGESLLVGGQVGQRRAAAQHTLAAEAEVSARIAWSFALIFGFICLCSVCRLPWYAQQLVLHQLHVDAMAADAGDNGSDSDASPPRALNSVLYHSWCLRMAGWFWLGFGGCCGWMWCDVVVAIPHPPPPPPLPRLPRQHRPTTGGPSECNAGGFQCRRQRRGDGGRGSC